VTLNGDYSPSKLPGGTNMRGSRASLNHHSIGGESAEKAPRRVKIKKSLVVKGDRFKTNSRVDLYKSYEGLVGAQEINHNEERKANPLSCEDADYLMGHV
jgi:hypothetical protein